MRQVIVNFAVKDNDDRLVFTKHWLMSSTNVNDRQSFGTQAYILTYVKALIIWASMRNSS